jgi:predicted naringenin-chalcone synthase
MVWQIGNHGFILHLSPDIPRQIGMLAPRALKTLLAGRTMPPLWAIHPGGRAIVDRTADLFQLTPSQIAPSLDILRRFGNMSSPTILFVIDELRARLRQSHVDTMRDGVAMAFGPGLVIEMAYLTYVPLDSALALTTAVKAPASVTYVA